MKKGIGLHLTLALAVTGTSCTDGHEEMSVGTSRLALQTSGPCASADPDSPLAQAACSTGRLIGTAAQLWILNDGDMPYRDALAREFTYVTPENEMKWGVLQPTDSTTWDFAAADALIATAKANGQAVKGHTLVWHEQLPPFVNEQLSKTELKGLLHEHIKQTVKHFRDDVVAWDVLNEVVLEDGSPRPTVFSEVLGPDYAAKVFTWAAEYAKDGDRYDADLYYNDWGIETINPKSDAVYALLADLLAQGIPVDGVGMQGHIDARYAPTTEGLIANFQRFADLGLSINISELDIRVAGIPGSRVDKLALQQQLYHRIAYACAQTDACNAITVWGVGDKYTWVDEFFGYVDDPLLLDTSFQRKPAYRGMVDGLLALEPDPQNAAPNLASSGSFETDAAGWYGFGAASLALDGTIANSGRNSLLASGRTQTYEGPALDLTGLVQPGFEYSASAFVRAVGAASAPINMNVKIRCAEPASEDYVTLASTTASDTSFSAVDGAFAIPYCVLAEAALYFSGPDAGVDIMVDDVVVRQTAEPLGPELSSDGGFETGTGGWFNFGAEPVLSLSEDAHAGQSALLTSNRAQTWQGPGKSLVGLLEAGGTYRISAFTKLVGAPEAGADVKLTVKSVCDGVDTYTGVASASAENSVWTELNGSYRVPLCDNFAELTVYLEGPDPSVSLLLDDVSIAQRLTIPMAPPANSVVSSDFESGQGSWYSWGQTLAVSELNAHTGTHSLVVTDAGVGKAVLDLKSVLLPGETYDLTYWVSISGADSASVHVAATADCGSGATYPWLTNNPTVVAGEWVKLTGTYEVPAGCSMTDMQFFVEGGNIVNSTGAVSLYVDDVSIVRKSSDPVITFASDFESGQGSWYSWGQTIGVTDQQSHGGTNSLVVTDAGVGKAVVQLKDVLVPGTTYRLSYWVAIAGADSASVHVTATADCGSGGTYPWVTNNPTVPAGTWVELTGTYTVPADCAMTDMQLYVEGGNIVNSTGSVSLYVDDVVISE